jgi:hypothetical protein
MIFDGGSHNHARQSKVNPVTEGDRRTETHARDCGGKNGRGACPMYCRCWCHGITKHTNGERRPDAA